MIYIVLGIVIGFFLNLVPLWQPGSGWAIYPEWHGKIESIKSIEISKSKNLSNIKLPPVKDRSNYFILSGSGEVLYNNENNEYLVSISGNGEYLVKYEKTGKSIELLSISGERFWKIESREYPYLSYNGKIILLMNGDHTSIRILDYNGNAIGAKMIVGRFCTQITFSMYSDFACIGFLDGSYYLINSIGEIVSHGVMPHGSLIKGMAVNTKGDTLAIHYGNNISDSVSLIRLTDNSENRIALKNIHLTKTAMHVSEAGQLAIIDYDRIILKSITDSIEKNIKIAPQKAGVSTLNYFSGLYVVSYAKVDGEAQFIIFQNNGTILYKKVFAEEPFLESFIDKSVIFLRGSQGLFCYSFDFLSNK
ncbi:MAG: hypothetical protein SVR08_09550 [Spirochaetota bacterium]|nr:hypothetical protein [Spirochaetota bacterium]